MIIHVLADDYFDYTEILGLHWQTSVNWMNNILSSVMWCCLLDSHTFLPHCM